jgi:hypothetical protein
MEIKDLPFDVAPYRTVPVCWDTPEDVKKSVFDLKAQLEAVNLPDYIVENPVTRARGQQHLRETATPTEKLLLEEVQRLSTQMAELERSAIRFSAAAPQDARAVWLSQGLHDPLARVPGLLRVLQEHEKTSVPESPGENKKQDDPS